MDVIVDLLSPLVATSFAPADVEMAVELLRPAPEIPGPPESVGREGTGELADPGPPPSSTKQWPGD